MVSPDRSKHFFKGSGLIWLAAMLFLLAGYINQMTPKPALNLNKQATAININKDLLIFISAGNKRLITDLLWVQTLLESDIEHYAERDLSNWMFIRFYTISALDPYFYQDYVWGGQYLSIVKDDLAGAVKLMERGVQFFPEDYRLNYNLGFTYYYELNDYKKGIGYLEKIENHPKAPPFIHSIIMKMKAELGFDTNALMALVAGLINDTKDPGMKSKLEADYYSLKAERDIVCLNARKANCETRDAYGVPYVKVGSVFHSQKSFIPYRLKRKGDNQQTRPVTTIEN